MVEDLAYALQAPPELPSRGGMALLHTLQLAAEAKGHTHLPWHTLAAQALRLMSSDSAASLPPLSSPSPRYALCF